MRQCAQGVHDLLREKTRGAGLEEDGADRGEKAKG